MFQLKLEDTNEIIRRRRSKDGLYNGHQKKKGQRIHNDLQNNTLKSIHLYIQ